MAMAVSLLTSTGETSCALGGATFAADARFLIYSVTKTLLAATALRLCDRGELALDVPIQRWLPRAPHADRLTLRQLLQHTSGLRDYGVVAGYHEAVARGDEPWADEDVQRRSRAGDLLFPPGQSWSYSNIGYLLVRRALEHVRAEPLGAVLRTELFGPLGLTGPFVATEREQLGAITFGGVDLFGGRSVRERYHPGWVLHGVVAATASEVTAMMRAILVESVLTPAALAEMHRMVPLPIDEANPGRARQPKYGLGLMELGEELAVVGHSGGGPGSTAAVYHRGDVTACALSDSDDLEMERWAVRTAALTHIDSCRDRTNVPPRSHRNPGNRRTLRSVDCSSRRRR